LNSSGPSCRKEDVRAARYLILAVAGLVMLFWAGAASALIVPQKSIAGIELNMTRPEVKDKKGQPDRIVHGTNDFGAFTHFIYKNAVGKLTATFQGNQGATAVRTNRETQKTAEGVHVGSPESALHDAYPRLHCRTELSDFRHCWTGRFRAGHKVTDYRIGTASGNVKSITVGFVID
jgi:hypothetical protein